MTTWDDLIAICDTCGHAHSTEIACPQCTPQPSKRDRVHKDKVTPLPAPKPITRKGKSVQQLVIPVHPLPKQSYRASKRGGYTPKRIKDYQQKLSNHANRVIATPYPADVQIAVEIWFYRGDKRRVDTDNLCKPVMDALNGIAWLDDKQVMDLYLHKRFTSKKQARVEVTIWQIDNVLEQSA